MTETNGWPGQPGVPPQDGIYWLKHNVVGDKQPCLYEKGKWYCCGSDIGLSPMRCAARYSYLGPCLTPDEAAALQARADQAALGHAREADRADQSEFLHKQEIAALQKRVAKLEALVKSAFTEGFNAGHEEGEELGEFTANGGDARRHESRGPIWHWQSSETKATLEGKKDE